MPGLGLVAAIRPCLGFVGIRLLLLGIGTLGGEPVEMILLYDEILLRYGRLKRNALAEQFFICFD